MNQSDPSHSNFASVPPPAPANRGEWAMGVLLAIGCIVMVVPLALAAGMIADQFSLRGEEQLGVMLTVVVLFGLSQWLFVVPMGLYLRYQGKTDTAKGLWISAGVAMLLNGACFGLVSIQ